jgi:D-3-phosphoglycerate dehydrogenase
LIDQQFFDEMRPGSLFVNAARAEVVDQAALERAVRSGKIRAALDVFNEEPSGGTGSIETEIFKLDGTIGSHHIGASTDQAQQAIADETVRIITEYKRTGRAPNVVNIARKSPATHLLVVRHYDRVGVLADVFTRLRSAGINVQETENIVFDGARAAVARIHLDQAAPDEVVEAIKSNTSDIIDVSLVKI